METGSRAYIGMETSSRAYVSVETGSRAYVDVETGSRAYVSVETCFHAGVGVSVPTQIIFKNPPLASRAKKKLQTLAVPSLKNFATAGVYFSPKIKPESPNVHCTNFTLTGTCGYFNP